MPENAERDFRPYWDTEDCSHCSYHSPGGKTLTEFPEDEVMLCEVCADEWEEVLNA